MLLDYGRFGKVDSIGIEIEVGVVDKNLRKPHQTDLIKSLRAFIQQKRKARRKSDLRFYNILHQLSHLKDLLLLTILSKKSIFCNKHLDTFIDFRELEQLYENLVNEDELHWFLAVKQLYKKVFCNPFFFNHISFVKLLSPLHNLQKSLLDLPRSYIAKITIETALQRLIPLYAELCKLCFM